MKKISITGSCMVLALTCSSYALEVNPFIGLNIGALGVSYEDKVKDDWSAAGVDLPTAFIGGGVEAGVKFESDRVYNAALTFAYDYALNSDADLKAPANQHFSSIEVGFSAYSVTFDNYLRVSGDAKHRQDIVLGAGIARANARLKQKMYGAGDLKNDDDDTAVVIKVGYNYKITDYMDWYLNGRWFIPTGSDNDINALFNGNVGVRFVF